MSKILFIGDSFTWGQGLYFYKWKDEGKEFPNGVGGHYPEHSNYVTRNDRKYKDEESFTGLVSNYYGLSPIKRETNGGSNTNLIIDMINMLDEHRNEIDKLVFQFTAASRYEFRDLNMDHIDYSEGTFEEIYDNRITNFFHYIDGILSYFSKLYKFEYCYLDWLGDFYKVSPAQFVTYDLNDVTYTHFNQFLDQYKIELDVDGTHIIDTHLNKDGQNIIAQSIIKHF
jgi:hypothetical protein